MCDNNRDEFSMTEVMEKEIKGMLKEDTQLILEGVIDGDRQLVVKNKMVWDNITNDDGDSEISVLSPYRRTFIHSRAFQVGMRRMRARGLQVMMYNSHLYDYDNNIPFWYNPESDRADIENAIKEIMLPILEYTSFDPVRFMMSPIPHYDSSFYYPLPYLNVDLSKWGIYVPGYRCIPLPRYFSADFNGDVCITNYRHPFTLHGRSLGKTNSIHSTFTDLVSVVRRQRVDHKFYQSKQKHFGRRSL